MNKFNNLELLTLRTKKITEKVSNINLSGVKCIASVLNSASGN